MTKGRNGLRSSLLLSRRYSFWATELPVRLPVPGQLANVRRVYLLSIPTQGVRQLARLKQIQGAALAGADRPASAYQREQKALRPANLLKLLLSFNVVDCCNRCA